MPLSPYPGFTPLNNRRLELIDNKYNGGGITEQEEREMEMLGEVVVAMCRYRWPMIDLNKLTLEKTGLNLDELLAKMEGEKPVLGINREADGIPCSCGGYAARVDCTAEEMKKVNCGRSYECCGRAFVCKVCKKRTLGRAESPEME